MSDYANEWALGAGSKVIFGSDTYADPKLIRMPNPGVFRKDLVTLGGVTKLVGKKRNKIGELSIVVAGGTAYGTLVTEPPTSGALWRVWPDGTSKSCTAYLVEEGPSEVTPENEEDRQIIFAPLAPLA